MRWTRARTVPTRYRPGSASWRPAAPELADTRILFTVEPSGTAVLLAAGTESDRLDAWYTEAIVRSRFRYQRTQRR